jgi:hypothetical protein
VGAERSVVSVGGDHDRVVGADQPSVGRAAHREPGKTTVTQRLARPVAASASAGAHGDERHPSGGRGGFVADGGAHAGASASASDDPFGFHLLGATSGAASQASPITASTELAAAAQAVIDAAALVSLSGTTRRFSDADAARLGQAVEALGDVLHRSAGKRRRDDERALRAALAAARGAADALAQFGYRNRHEVALRQRIGMVERLAAEVDDAPVQHAAAHDLRDQVERSLRQLTRAAEQVAPFAEVKHAELAAAIETTRGWRDELADADAGAARRLSLAIAGQQEILFQAAGELDQLLAGPVLPTTGHVVAAYAHAMATSTERATTAHKVLAWARTENRRQLVHLAAELIDEDAGNVAALKGSGIDARGEHTALDRRREGLDRRLLAGAKVDDLELRELLLDSRAEAFDHRMHALEIQIHQFADALAAADEGVMAWVANRFDRDIHRLPGELRSLANVPGTFRNEVRRRRARALIDLAAADGRALTRDQREHMLAARSLALDYVEGHAQDWLASSYLDDRLRFAESELKDAQVRLTAVTLASTVALTLAGNFVASAARGGMTGLTVGRGLTFARNAGAAAGLAADVAVNTIGQKVLLGDDASVATLLVLNSGGALVGHTISKQFRDLDDVERLGAKSATLWQKVGRGGQVGLMGGVELSAQMVAGAAQDYVVRRGMGERTADPGGQSAEDWLLQGAAIALGRFVGTRTRKQAEHLEHRVRDQVLAARARALSERAVTLERSGDVDAAVAMLGEYRELLDAEHAVLEVELARHADHAGTIDRATLVADIRANNRATAGLEQLDLPGIALRGGGLRPANAAGHTWEGTAAQVEQAVGIAKKLGLTVIEPEPGSGRHAEIAGRRIDILELGRDARTESGSRASDGAASRRSDQVVLQGDDTEIEIYARNVRPLPGTLDVFVHGTVDEFIVMRDGVKIVLDHRRLATYLGKADVRPRRVRLIACQSGAHPKGAAQHLANKLGIPVLAPTDLVHINQETGALTVGPDELTPTGTWIEYTPAPSERRFVPWRETAPTETRYERFKRERAAAGHDDQGGDDAGRRSKVMGSDGGDHALDAAADDGRARRRAAAAAELSTIPIAVAPGVSSGRVTYVVRSGDGHRIARLFADIEGAQVIEFKTALLVRHGGSEWYFSLDDRSPAERPGAAIGPAHAQDAARGVGGLPPPNVVSVELWGFRGVREIKKPGETRARESADWTAEERAEVAAETSEEPLLEFGHVGISFDGGKTIHALTPKPPPEVELPELKRRLKAGEVFPGRVRDDGKIFKLAEQMAEERGWNTRPVRAIVLLDPEVGAKTHERIAAQEGMEPGAPDVGEYGFPKRDGTVASDDVNNCATYPRHLGLPIPEATGSLRDYIPELERWAHADAPIDARSEEPTP